MSGRILILSVLSVVLVACGSSGGEQDTTAPVITLTGANPQVIEAGTPYVELGASAMDYHDGDLSNAIVIDASQVDTTVPGSYSVTYSATDAAGNRATITRTVVVEDTTPPVIRLLGDDPQVIEAGSAYIEHGATATDSLDGDLGATIVIDASAVNTALPADYAVSYDVSDAAGNAAVTVTRNVLVRDTTPPVITLLGDDPQVIISGNPYSELGAIAFDSLDGDLSPTIVIDSSAVDTMAVGDYTVTYDVTDSAGNFAESVNRTVSVQNPPGPEVSVAGDIKTLIFNWTESEGAEFYRLLENVDGHSGFSKVGDDIPAETLMAERKIAVHLFDWVNAQYLVEACNSIGCNSSEVVTALDAMLETIGYFKASDTGSFDQFGRAVALSADSSTLAVGAYDEHSRWIDINGDETDNSVFEAGAVYLFRFDGTSWTQEAYINASNMGDGDAFGWTVALSADGNTLAVGAPFEASSATGINGDQDDNSAGEAGAVYLLRFDGTSWAQQAYIKASNTDYGDHFGRAVALSADGNTLAVGAHLENSSATGINGDQADNSAGAAGAVYLFRFNGTSWAQHAYIKASNTGSGDGFGWVISLSADGNSLAAGAYREDSVATGINGDQEDNSAYGAGAVYLFRFDGKSWAQQAYIKASNTDTNDDFGSSVTLNADGNTLAVGAWPEHSSATGINGDQADNSASDAGAVYLFRFDGASWAQQAYIKASNTGGDDRFGSAVALSADGNTLAVGADDEDGSASGINGDEADNSVMRAGAVYLFRFDGGSWAQQAYIKASNPGGGDYFGHAVALSADGDTLVAGAWGEDSSATGINGDQAADSAASSGAVYVY